MSKRIITLGTWNGKPIDWLILSEDNFSTLVISRFEIGRMYFNGSSSNNNWDSSDLRKFLNNCFYETAFNEDEKKKIVNTKLTDANNCKDDVFILSEKELKALLDDDDEYESKYYRSCSYCVWTRTKDGNSVRHGYAGGCWCSHSASNSYAVRPAMYLKK